MRKTVEKMKFALCVLLYPLRSIMDKVGIKYDIVESANAYYRDVFNRTPRKYRAVILPHCLIDEKCPAKFSKEEGILCVKCKRCKCGEIGILCEEMGYQFYISPSSGFTQRLAQRKKMKAAIGGVCMYEVEKGLQTFQMTGKGILLQNGEVIPQILLAAKYDCLNNDIDWERLKEMINDDGA